MTSFSFDTFPACCLIVGMSLPIYRSYRSSETSFLRHILSLSLRPHAISCHQRVDHAYSVHIDTIVTFNHSIKCCSMLRSAQIDITGALCVHHQKDQKIVFSRVLKGMRTSSPVSSVASKKHQLSGFYNGEGGGEYLPRVSH